MADHLTFGIATSGTYPAWTTPDKSIPVTSADFTGTRVNNRFEDTGATVRSRKYHSQGAVTGTGSISMRAYPVYLIPWVFRSFLTDAAESAEGDGYDTDLLPNDGTDTQLPWFSFQQKYNASVGQSARGCVVNSITLSASGGEEANVSLDFVVADTARVGGNWSDGSTSAPTLATPTYPDLPAPWRFHEGVIIQGGTPSKSTNKLNIAGGTTVATIESLSLSIALNVEGRFAIRDGMPTIAYTRHGERNIELTAEIDWADFGTDYYDAMKAATETAMRLSFISDSYYSGSNPYELIITLPRMVYPEDGGPFPQVDGTHMPKRQALKWIALEHATLATDIGVSIQTTDRILPS